MAISLSGCVRTRYRSYDVPWRISHERYPYTSTYKLFLILIKRCQL